jgi:hypothetical protein
MDIGNIQKTFKQDQVRSKFQNSLKNPENEFHFHENDVLTIEDFEASIKEFQGVVSLINTVLLDNYLTKTEVNVLNDEFSNFEAKIEKFSRKEASHFSVFEKLSDILILSRKLIVSVKYIEEVRGHHGNNSITKLAHYIDEETYKKILDHYSSILRESKIKRKLKRKLNPLEKLFVQHSYLISLIPDSLSFNTIYVKELKIVSAFIKITSEIDIKLNKITEILASDYFKNDLSKAKRELDRIKENKEFNNSYGLKTKKWLGFINYVYRIEKLRNAILNTHIREK